MGYLRYINYYLERSGNCPDETIRQRYDGVAYFFRALFYFEKVRKYGDIPYYDFVIPSNDWASLKRPRDSRGFVMKKVMVSYPAGPESSSRRPSGSGSPAAAWRCGACCGT